MTLTRRDFFKATGAAGAALAVGWHFHAAAPARAAADDPLYHILQRATWGARPADLERIRQMGAQAFIDRRIGDRLANLNGWTTLTEYLGQQRWRVDFWLEANWLASAVVDLTERVVVEVSVS